MISIVDIPGFAEKIYTLTTLSDILEPIFTIAANARKRKTVIDRVTRAIDSGVKGIRVVAGCHPIRKIPRAYRFLPMNSFRILSLLHSMRSAEELPPDLAIWAVENPFASRLVAAEARHQG